MNIQTTPLKDLLMITPKRYGDNRGYFLESFQQQRYGAFAPPFVQDNMSRSKKNVLRGLHYQYPNAQGKLVWVLRGEVLDVVVDIRLNSPTFGQTFSVLLSGENHIQLYVPPGFAHGFCVLSDEADFYYKCTDYYQPEHEHGIVWNDPALNIDWPTHHPILSNKDQQYPTLNEIPRHALFP